MTNKNTLRKLGVVRSGAVASTYKNAKDRPTELQMDDVYDAKKDLIGGDESNNNKEHKSTNNDKTKTNPLAIIGS